MKFEDIKLNDIVYFGVFLSADNITVNKYKVTDIHEEDGVMKYYGEDLDSHIVKLIGRSDLQCMLCTKEEFKNKIKYQYDNMIIKYENKIKKLNQELTYCINKKNEFVDKF